MLQSQSKGSF